MTKKPKILFSAVLEGLLDNNRPFPPAYIDQLSDLSPQNQKSLQNIWQQIKTERRISLLEDLKDIQDSDTILSFARLAEIAMNDPVPQVRALAILLLWDFPEIDYIPKLIYLAKNDPDVSVREHAASALGVYVYEGEMEEIPAAKLHLVEETLITIYTGNDDMTVRRHALESLGFSSRKEVVKFISKAFADPDNLWKASALFAMGRSGLDKQWGASIIPMLTSGQYDIQLEAIRAAGALALADARQPLLDLLESGFDDDELRDATIWALAQIGGEGVREVIEDLLDKADEADEDIDFLEECLEDLQMTEELNSIDLDLVNFEEDQDDDDLKVIKKGTDL